MKIILMEMDDLAKTGWDHNPLASESKGPPIATVEGQQVSGVWRDMRVEETRRK